jgi:hypothetical protein
MHAATLRLALFAPAMLLFGASSTTPAALMKCGPQLEGTKPVVRLDGAFASATDPQALLKTLDPKEVTSIAIRCLNPADSTEIEKGSGLPAIFITTKQGPASFLKPTLASIVAAQDAHFALHSTYISDAANIALPFRSARLNVSLDVRANGWIAKATFDDFASTCYVFAGNVAAPAKGLQLKQPKCIADR